MELFPVRKKNRFRSNLAEFFRSFGDILHSILLDNLLIRYRFSSRSDRPN